MQVIVRARLDIREGKYDQEQIDCLLDFMEEVGNALADAGHLQNSALMGGENSPLFEPEKLDDNLFYAGLLFTYRTGSRGSS